MRNLIRETGASRLCFNGSWEDIPNLDNHLFFDDAKVDLAIQTLVTVPENESLLRRAISRAFLYGKGLVSVRWGCYAERRNPAFHNQAHVSGLFD